MEKATAPHSSSLAWKIPWAEEPGRLQSMGSLRVGHDWVTSLSFFTFMHWRRKWQPTPVFLPGESQGWGSLMAAVYGVSQSWTQLKWLSSSSSSSKVQKFEKELKIPKFIPIPSLIYNTNGPPTFSSCENLFFSCISFLLLYNNLPKTLWLFSC